MGNENERLVPRNHMKKGYVAPAIGDILSTNDFDDGQIDMAEENVGAKTPLAVVFKVRLLMRNSRVEPQAESSIIIGMNPAAAIATMRHVYASSLGPNSREVRIDLVSVTNLSDKKTPVQVWQILYSVGYNLAENYLIGPEGIEALIQAGIVSRAEMFPSNDAEEVETPCDEPENPDSYCGEDGDKDTVDSPIDYEKTLYQMQRQLLGWFTQQPLSMTLEQCNRLRAALATLSWVHGAFAANRANKIRR